MSFWQKPNSHLNGHGCPKCTNIISKPETKWLDSLNIPEEWRQKTLQVNKKRYIPDAYDEENKVCYFFHGDYWHGNPNKYNSNELNQRAKKTFGELYKRTIDREKELISYGYKIITMWESDWKAFKQD